MQASALHVCKSWIAIPLCSCCSLFYGILTNLNSILNTSNTLTPRVDLNVDIPVSDSYTMFLLDIQKVINLCC